MALTDKIKILANAIRAKAGTTAKMTLDEMASTVNALETTEPTIVLQDEAGYEVVAVLTDEPVTLTATENDIRMGTTAVTNFGVTEGTKVIPSYHIREGYKIVTPGSTVFLTNQDNTVNDYDYTKMQAMICLFNANEADSVSTTKVSINDGVYNVQSTELLSSVTKNHESKNVEFGITNDSSSMWILRFFMYKEIK